MSPDPGRTHVGIDRRWHRSEIGYGAVVFVGLLAGDLVLFGRRAPRRRLSEV